jgi:hypothetical protein
MTDSHYMGAALRKHGKMPMCMRPAWNGERMTSNNPPWCTGDVTSRWLKTDSTLAMWDTRKYKPEKGSPKYVGFGPPNKVEYSSGPHPVVFKNIPSAEWVLELQRPYPYSWCVARRRRRGCRCVAPLLPPLPTPSPATASAGAPLDAAFSPYFARKWKLTWSAREVAGFMAALAKGPPAASKGPRWGGCP